MERHRTVLITRVRSGLATNSSSSHSMVVLPPGVQVPDEVPGFSARWRHVYEDTWVAASELEKRHVLAGMLAAQSCELWGRGVFFGDRLQAAREAFMAESPDDWPDDDWPDDDWPDDDWPGKEGFRQPFATEVTDTPRSEFNTVPLDSQYGPSRHEVALPGWLQREIAVLCGLPEDTDLTRHWADSDLSGGVTRIPRAPHGTGPDKAAWAALSTVALDPRTVLLSPEHNNWHELQVRYEETETDLGTAAHLS